MSQHVAIASPAPQFFFALIRHKVELAEACASWVTGAT